MHTVNDPSLLSFVGTLKLCQCVILKHTIIQRIQMRHIAWIHIIIPTCIFIFIFTYKLVCISIYIYIQTCIYFYLYIYIDAYTYDVPSNMYVHRSGL